MKGSPPGKKADPVPDVAVGDVDPMSQMGNATGLPLCRQYHNGGFYSCTRVTGHDEAKPNISAKHVATDQNFVALEVWT